MLKHSILLALLSIALGFQPAHAKSPPLFVFADIGDGQLGLINTETDQLIQVDVVDLDGWPGNGVVVKQHAWVTTDAKTIYMSIDATPPSPAGIVVFAVKGIDWDAGVADISIQKSLIVDAPGSLPDFPFVEEVDPEQPIMGWTQASYTQIHGPSLRPHSTLSYATIWTDDRIVAFDTKRNEFARRSPFSFGDFSRQTHGLAFNPSGTLALGTGYYYDQTTIDLYAFTPGKAKPKPKGSIKLKKGKTFGAFTHYTTWLNDRYAYTATQQFARTSLTAAKKKISSPGIWFLDTRKKKAKRVVGTAQSADEPGIFRSASDVNIANGKLYVAEEDTLDGTFGNDGYVSIFDLRRPKKPRFLKRLKPGSDLPKDFAVAHGLTVTPDQRFVFVASYASSYIAKIDTETDRVVKVWGPDDGLSAPHGGFIAGSNR
jgi:hypothetical protein